MQVKTGIGVIVVKDSKVLLGKRLNSHGGGTWSFPGGHLEMFETWEQCAIREVLEETDISIANLRFAAVTNDIFREEDKHYITIFILADYSYGNLKVNEPHKCEKWEWFDWNNLPSPLFLPIQNLLQQGYDPESNKSL
jgi:8-oxo-dGTP diphosphatase